jgi:hypothetical protein
MVWLDCSILIQKYARDINPAQLMPHAPMKASTISLGYSVEIVDPTALTGFRFQFQACEPPCELAANGEPCISD